MASTFGLLDGREDWRTAIAEYTHLYTDETFSLLNPDAAQQAAVFVTGEQQHGLQQPSATLEDEALAPLTDEYAGVASTLDAAAQDAAGVEALAGELAKCQHVVGQIDELLQAIGG